MERAVGRALAGLSGHVAVLWPRADRMATRRPEEFAVARRVLGRAGHAASRAGAASGPTEVAVVVFSRRMRRPEPPFVWQGR